MSVHLTLTDGESTFVVDAISPGAIVARVQAIDPVGLTRSDVRKLRAFLEALDD